MEIKCDRNNRKKGKQKKRNGEEEVEKKSFVPEKEPL